MPSSSLMPAMRAPSQLCSEGSADNACQYDCLVFIGRFQPVHHGHVAIMEEALRRARQVIVLVGSAWQARSLRNPFTFDERTRMIRSCFGEDANARLEIVPLLDALYNDDVWVRDVQRKVRDIARPQANRMPRIALIGATHGNDNARSSYYLSLFPQWESVAGPYHEGMVASHIRDVIFSERARVEDWLDNEGLELLPGSVAEHLRGFLEETAWQGLVEERRLLEQYRAAWSDAPYPPLFITVNAVVVQSGHILLTTRRAAPGKGLYALPGGFVQSQERLLDACLRELRERVRLKVPEPVLRGSLRGQRLFDEPHRSWRGRTLAEAFYFALRPEQQLPKLRSSGKDSEEQARWVALADLEPDTLFEDHFFIIQNFLGLHAGQSSF